MSKSVQEVFNEVAVAEGVEVKKVKNTFLWYDLLSSVLSFQILYIVSATTKMNFGMTLFSALCVLVMDSTIFSCLKKNPSSYQSLKNNVPLVKLWTVPLLILSIAVLTILVVRNV